jgi:hypothetical protein
MTWGQGSIPHMDKLIFKIPFSPSPSFGVTKPTSLRLAISSVNNYPSKAKRAGSYKWSVIKADL